MIIDVEKYLIFGSMDDLDPFFAKAQKLGCIEFISPIKKKAEDSEVKKFIKAIKIAKKQTPTLPLTEKTPIFPITLAERIIHASNMEQSLHEERRMLKAEMARIAPFGDFSLDDVAVIESKTNRALQFFCRKTSKKEDHEIPKELIYLATEYDLDYFVAINKEKKSYPKFIEIEIEKSWGTLYSHLHMVEEKMEKFHKEQNELASYLPSLQKALVDRLNQVNLMEAKSHATKPISSLFAVESWIPKNKVEDFQKLLAEFSIDHAQIAIEKEDRVPTYMENEGTARLGEDLVHIYDTPSTTDKDPSSWVFWAFALFFGIIVADAGYGFLYFLLSLFLFWKFPKTEGLAKRFIKLCFSLSLFCMGWGILTASFFGIDLSPKNSLRKASLIHFVARQKAEYHWQKKDDVYQEWTEKYPQLKDQTDGQQILNGAVEVREGTKHYSIMEEFNNNILMEVSLLIGMIHICLSLLRTIWRSPHHLGWLAFVIGGYLYFPSILNATSLFHYLFMIPKESAFYVGELLLYGGISAAFVIALITKRLSGLMEPMNAIQIFADVLSYLRLYALALASMIVASTCNEIASSMPWWAGIFVVMLGHGCNILIGIMGGVIHGLRLNFLEWYHYCFEGGGRLFDPLRLIKK